MTATKSQEGPSSKAVLVKTESRGSNQILFYLVFLVAAISGLASIFYSNANPESVLGKGNNDSPSELHNFYSFSANDINLSPVNFNKYQNKVDLSWAFFLILFRLF